MPANTVDTQPAGGTPTGTDKLLAWRVAGGSITLTAAAFAAYVLASPTLTGTPTAPTASPGTNTTQLATTAFVATAVGAATVADGDKTDITVSSSGTVWNVDPDVVGNAELRNSAGLSLIGRSANSTGDPADITAATAAHVMRVNTAGTALEWNQVSTAGIEVNAVTDAVIRNSGALSVIGRSANSTGDPADISATAGAYGALRERGSVVSFRRESYQALTVSSGVATFTVSTSPNATIAHSVTTDTFEIDAISPVGGETGLVIVSNATGAQPYDTPTWELNGSTTNVVVLAGVDDVAFGVNNSDVTVYCWTFDGTRLVVWIEASSFSGS